LLAIDRWKAAPKYDPDRRDVGLALESDGPPADGQRGRSQGAVKRTGARFGERLRARRELRFYRFHGRAIDREPFVLIEHLFEVKTIVVVNLEKPAATSIATDDDGVTVRNIVIGFSRGHAGAREEHERPDRL
jgi:hypothetical protein